MKQEQFFKNMVGKIIAIDWRDSNLFITQCNINDNLDISVITSIGKLVSVDINKIVIAGDLVQDSQDIRRVISIPMENVIGLNDEYKQ